MCDNSILNGENGLIFKHVRFNDIFSFYKMVYWRGFKI